MRRSSKNDWAMFVNVKDNYRLPENPNSENRFGHTGLYEKFNWTEIILVITNGIKFETMLEFIEV